MVVILKEFQGVKAITPSDATDLTSFGICGLYVGTTGDVAVTCRDGSTGTFHAVPAGTTIKNLEITFVLSTGTTASNILGLVGR
jgi:hypothetical protein